MGGGILCSFFPRRVLRWSARRGDKNAMNTGQAGVLRVLGVVLLILGVGAIYLINS
jgi:hypothetical protein